MGDGEGFGRGGGDSGGGSNGGSSGGFGIGSGGFGIGGAPGAGGIRGGVGGLSVGPPGSARGDSGLGGGLAGGRNVGGIGVSAGGLRAGSGGGGGSARSVSDVQNDLAQLSKDASKSVADAIAAVAKTPAPKTWRDIGNTALGILGNAGLVVSGNPVAQARGLYGLVSMAADSGFSLGGGESTGETSTRVSNGGRPDGVFSGVSFGSNVGGNNSAALLSLENQKAKAGVIPRDSVGVDAVPIDETGAVAYTPAQSQLTQAKPFDIMGLIVPIGLFLILKG